MPLVTRRAPGMLATSTFAVALGIAMFGVAGCAAGANADAGPTSASPSPTERTCPAGGSEQTVVQLYFGQDIPGGGQVTKRQWQGFVDQHLTRAFPDGLSVFAAQGQWKDQVTGRIVRERSREVTLIAGLTPQVEQKIEAVRAAYKDKFAQQSVLRVDLPGCVDF